MSKSSMPKSRRLSRASVVLGSAAMMAAAVAVAQPASAACGAYGCGAKRTSACSPCAGAKANPCSPCGAAKCSPDVYKRQADDLGTFLTHSAFLSVAVFGAWYMWRVAPKKLDLTFSQDGVTYVFWTRKGDVTRNAPYTSYTGIQHTHTTVHAQGSEIHNHKVLLVHPDPLLTLTLVTLSGDFDKQLCELYADATGLPILEAQSKQRLWRFLRLGN